MTGQSTNSNKDRILILIFQFVAMVMFGLVMSEDICSKQDRRNEILRGLANLPAMMEKVYRDCFEKDNKIVAASERIRKDKSVIILSRGKTSRNK